MSKLMLINSWNFHGIFTICCVKYYSDLCHDILFRFKVLINIGIISNIVFSYILKEAMGNIVHLMHQTIFVSVWLLMSFLFTLWINPPVNKLMD